MLPDLTTYAHAADLDRALALRRAERRALLLDAAERPRPARRLPARTAAMCSGWLARAVLRSLCRVLRPAHA